MNDRPAPPAEADGEDPQYLALRAITERVLEAEFSEVKLKPQIESMVALLGQVCPSDEEIGRMLPRVDWIVRRYRLLGYFISFWMQLLTLRRGSVYHVLTCRLYADAQTHLAQALAVNSLENAYTALGGRHSRGDEQLVPVALTLTEMQIPKNMSNYSYEGLVAASDRLERARSNPHDFLREDLATRMHAYHSLNKQWATTRDYINENPITANFFHYRTELELSAVHPIETKPGSQPGGLLFLIEQLGHPDNLPTRLAARRVLATTRQRGGDVEMAIEQFRLGAEEAAAGLVETELGHMLRGLGFALYAAKRFDEAVHQFEQAVLFERSMPQFSYWLALSACELGNARVGALSGKEYDPNVMRETLQSGMEAYNYARYYWEGVIATEVIPIDRTVKQQIFRCYRDNAVETAFLTSDYRQLLIDIESNAPREVGSLMAEIRAARELPIGDKGFREAVTVFQRHLTAAPDDFSDYVGSLIEDHEARNLYLQARTGDEMTAAAYTSQNSQGTVDRLMQAELPDVVVLALDLSWRATTFAYVVPERQEVTLAGRGDFGERDLLLIRDTYAAALKAADGLAEPARGRAVRSAIDQLIMACDRELGEILEAGLPLYAGRQLKILPRMGMTSFPLHAMHVGDARLIETCDVSYAPSLATFLAAHDRPARSEPASILMAHDDLTAPLFAGTATALSSVFGDRLTVLSRPAWDSFRQVAETAQGELFLACHGSHDPEAPAASCVWLDRRSAPPVTFADLLPHFDASRFDSVVLAACESGLVRAEAAAEYSGLPVVFLASGVRHVISSLWRAHQVATAIIMELYFMGRAAGTAPPVALCDAQRLTASLEREQVSAWLQSRTPEHAEILTRALARMEPLPFAHPYYWAAFQVNGGA